MKVGPSTLVVSLPSKWVSRFRLKKADELFLEEQGDTLRVTTEKKLKEDYGSVDISDPDKKVLHKVISNLYKMGYKKIRIKYDANIKMFHRYKEVGQFELVRNRVEHFTGMAITDIRTGKNNNIIEVEERAEVSYQEFEKTLDKTFYYLINQNQQIFEAMNHNKKNIKNEVWMSERLINQSTDFCMRILNTRGYEDYKKTGVAFYLVNRIEELGDEYYHMYMYYHTNDFNVSKAHLKILKETNKVIENMFRIHGKFDVIELEMFSNSVSSLIKDYENNFTTRMSIKQLRCITYVYSILQKLKDLEEIFIALNHEEFAV